MSALEVDMEAEKLDSQTLSESIEELEGIREQQDREIRLIKEGYVEKTEELAVKEEQIASMQTELQELQKKTSDEMDKAKTLETMYAKLKVEKKQLKTYALQMKAQSDNWTEEKRELEGRVSELEKKKLEILRIAVAYRRLPRKVTYYHVYSHLRTNMSQAPH